MIKVRKNIDRRKSIKSEQSGRVFPKKEQKNKKLNLSEEGCKSLQESFSRFKKEFVAYKQ